MNKSKKVKIRKEKQRFHSFSVTPILTIIAVIIVVGGVMWFEQPRDRANKAVASTGTKTVLPEITVYKSATCDCCRKWVEHLESEGFIVTAHNENKMNEIKVSLGVIPGLASCHTATVEGYVIEGHVPSKDIIRLLTEKPEAMVGLTAPRMPKYSPGMQLSGLEPRGYDVLIFDKEGNTQVFTSY
jgi:hypothetical protein